MESILLVNHIGYQKEALKKFVFQTKVKAPPIDFIIIDKSGKKVFKNNFKKGGQVDNWHTGNAYSGDFSELQTHGEFQIITILEGRTVKSRFFKIYNKSYANKNLELLIEGFESQHVVGEYAEKDKKMSFFGERNDIVDVSGGWYDASGEKGKYLSHLCFSNYFNPQQTPMFVWSLLESINQYKKNHKIIDNDLVERMKSEAAFGADFLTRMLDSEGYFYLTIFAKWTGDPKQRDICGYVGQDGKKTSDYRAGFREGAGIAIAALARASKEIDSGEFNSKQYLEAAKKGFEHLLINNKKYIDDGVENIIDDYCALLAATELYGATNEGRYHLYAQARMQKLIDKLKSDQNFNAWWSVNEKSSRPYFHGAEAGFPLVSLARYLDFEKEEKFRNKAISTIQKSIDFELAITNETHNPFGYPRQYVKAINEKNNRSSFFIPHQNETGYWWQGENSRLASMIVAFNMSKQYMSTNQKGAAICYTSNIFNWFFGVNPYDITMLDGIGYNNPDYNEEGDSLNFKGGVCNGITAGFNDENDIAFMPNPQNDDISHRWRWSEQWMPHGAWLMLAISSKE